MAKKDGRRYTAKFKFQVVLEALRSQKPDAEVAWAYQVNQLVTASEASSQALSLPSPLLINDE